LARAYRQSRRGETAEETRRRIVQACFQLHAEQGLVATTMKQIAHRAGVSVGSVYHHFPTYDDAIRACGAHAFAVTSPPSEALFDGVPDRAERVRRLALAFYRFFERVSAWGYVQAEQEQLPVVKPFVDEERRLRELLSRAAVGEGEGRGDPGRAAMLAALLDHGTYQALRDQGLGADEAARRIAEVANAWLAASAAHA
jgi:AcrR family transcriptional regulator